MKKFIIVLIIIVALTLLISSARAGTLTRGVHLNPFFIAGGAYGQPYITQLKYQMAVDTRVGLKSRYSTVTNSYNTYDSCTFNTFESVISGGVGDVVINNTYGGGS